MPLEQLGHSTAIEPHALVVITKVKHGVDTLMMFASQWAWLATQPVSQYQLTDTNYDNNILSCAFSRAGIRIHMGV
jgi:hypothetical protein